MANSTQIKINNINRKLLDKNTDKISLVCAAMCDTTYEELNIIYSKVSVLHKGLFALPFLKRKSYNDIFKRGYYLSNDSIAKYIGVVLFVLERNAQLINSYLRLREKYEDAYLLGKYNLACQYLNDINSKISFSVWGAEQELKLKRITEGTSVCAKFCNQLKVAKYKLGFMSSYFFKTSSIDYPFDSDVNNFYKAISDDSISKDLCDSIVSQTCAFVNNYKTENWIYELSQSSLIDLYNSIRDNVWVLTRGMEIESPLLDYLEKWHSLFSDQIIAKFLSIKNPIKKYIQNTEIRDNLILCYYKGLYQDVIEIAEEYIKDNPSDFAIVELYARAMNHCDRLINEVNEDSSILEVIKYHYYNFISGGSSAQLHLNKLSTICKSMYSFQCMRYLYEVINGLGADNIFKIGGECYKYSPYYNFSDLVAFVDSSTKHLYLHSWNSLDSMSILSDILDGKLRDVDMHYAINSDCADTKCVYDIVSCEWNSENIPVYYRNTAVSFMFNYLVCNSIWIDAINLYVNSHLVNENLRIIFDVKSLYKKLEAEVVDDLGIPLQIAIFYSMIDYASAKRYIAYKHALKHLGVKRASEIRNTNDTAIRYFLKCVCVKKVIGLHRAQFHTYDEIVEERKLICNNLYEDTQDKLLLNEIAGLAKEQLVKRLIQKVDESRIYVDEEGILLNELSEEKVLYSMYKAADKNIYYKESGIGILLDILGKKLLNNDNIVLLNISENSDETSINYKESLFRQLYLAVRNKFLLNPKYGLNFHLSTRIRHGSLINQLRVHLEKHSLVTNIGNGGKYTINTFWTDNVLELEGEARTRVQDLLLEFTKTVDTSILRIKDEYVQIKTEEYQVKQLAAFDFSYENVKYEIQYLSQICENSQFVECVFKIFENLWAVTELCITNLKSLIDQEKNKILALLSNLNKNIIDAVGGDADKVSKITTAITRCGTEIQGDFKIVHGWLQRRDTTAFGFSIQNVIDTCTSVISGMNVSDVHIEEKSNSYSQMKGLYFNYVYDILHNMLNNVMTYQKKSNVQVNCCIEADEHEGNLILKVSNNIRGEDIDRVDEELKCAEYQREEYIRSGKVLDEGKTGISKIYNMVMYILKDDGNYYKNSIDRDNNMVTSEVCLNLNKIKL